MPNWEYLVFRTRNFRVVSVNLKEVPDPHPTIVETLSAIGREGWELIAVTPLEMEKTNASVLDSLLYTLKRRVE